MGKSVSVVQALFQRCLSVVQLFFRNVANVHFYSEAWRYTGPFTRWNRFKGAFPGLGIATVAFAAYCGYEYLFLNDDHHGHGEASHGEGHP